MTLKPHQALSFWLPLCDSDSCAQSQTFPSGVMSAEYRSLHGFLHSAEPPPPPFRCRKPTLERSSYIIVQALTDTACAQKRPDMCTYRCLVSTFWPPSFHLSLRLSSYLSGFTKRERVALKGLIKICSLPSQISSRHLWWEDREMKLSSGRAGW